MMERLKGFRANKNNSQHFSFGIDTFYQGGWVQALEDRDKREKEVQKIIAGYKEVPYGPKW
ncbi:hypothetical protein IR022_02290 [Dysgonomonas sp. GY617]|nr:hypothetical protein [Dysgonomonas sp. GY617]